MAKDFKYYSHKFKKLRVDHSRGTAPYQPLLLLALLELIDQGIVTGNQFKVSPELISIFIQYRDQLSLPKFKADPAQPFYHMSRPKNAFWHLMPKAGHELILESKVRLNTLRKLRDHIEYGFLDSELFELLKSRVTRSSFIAEVLQTWFPSKRDMLEELFQVNSFEQFRWSLREKGGAVYSTGELSQEEEADAIVRDAAFRRNVISLYDQRCVFCRLKVISYSNENIVDGAHIKPFSTFRDDRYTNGLALCKNHHWAFDHGWFGIDDNYQILIPPDRLVEEPPPQTLSMMDFRGEQILLPQQERFFPDPKALSWHREHWQIPA